jgi:hypothetical protein
LLSHAVGDARTIPAHPLAFSIDICRHRAPPQEGIIRQPRADMLGGEVRIVGFGNMYRF